MTFRPATQDDLAPGGATAKVTANLAALTLLRELQTADRAATAYEQRLLARWSGWGAVPAVFDEHNDRFADTRAELKQLFDEREWRAASKTTLNAHYTDAAIAQTMWDVVIDAGFGTDGAPVRVLEPGCGAGTFIGLAPATVMAKDGALFGVELDPTTAAIAQHLYPHADIRQESFADTRIPRDYLDLVIGNVPFGKVALHDPVHNGGNHSLHNHFIIKSLALTRPGGVVTVLTSHYTMDATRAAANDSSERFSRSRSVTNRNIAARFVILPRCRCREKRTRSSCAASSPSLARLAGRRNAARAGPLNGVASVVRRARA